MTAIIRYRHWDESEVDVPVHDWSKVVAGNFHDFHQAWIIEIRNALNRGLLPESFYAMAEQVSKGTIPDVVTLESTAEFLIEEELDFSGSSNVMTVVTNPPKVQYREQTEVDTYADKADRLAIRHANGDRMVALIDIVSLGNKSTEAALIRFRDKLTEALEQGCHLMVIDLHRPHTHDPRGLHAYFWEQLQGISHGVTDQQPFGVSSYCAEANPTAYFQPVGLNEVLPEMPLFLTTQHYINVPLEETYMKTWSDLPRRWRDVLQVGSGSD